MVATQPPCQTLGAVGDDPDATGAALIAPAAASSARRPGAWSGRCWSPWPRVGIFATWPAASRGPTARYVVAARSRRCRRPPRRRPISRAVSMRRCRRPSLERSFSTAGAVVRGSHPRAPRAGRARPGGQRRCRRARPSRTPELSFAIDTDRAVAGSSAPGDRVDAARHLRLAAPTPAPSSGGAVGRVAGGQRWRQQRAQRRSAPRPRPSRWPIGTAVAGPHQRRPGRRAHRRPQRPGADVPPPSEPYRRPCPPKGG